MSVITDSVVEVPTNRGGTPCTECLGDSKPHHPYVLGVGVDLVHVPSFAEQLDVPGSRFAGLFTPGERADIAERSAHGGGSDARHWAVRWAAKEAVIKAWSASIFGEAPVMGDEAFGQIETITDAWGRPQIRLYGDVARHLRACTIDISLSHDGDHAIAYSVLSACSR